jgi:hypothetical protein
MTFADKLKSLRERATPGPCRIEHSATNGAEVWQNYVPTGSILVAKFGHAKFDKSNAELYTHLANHAAEIEDLFRKTDKLISHIGMHGEADRDKIEDRVMVDDVLDALEALDK